MNKDGYYKGKCAWCRKEGIIAFDVCTKCAENYFRTNE
jgi:hypothetical protein